MNSGADRLRGRVALITGAAGGLGAALVHSLWQRGATVVACDVDTGSLGHLEGERVRPWRMDLADPEDIQCGLRAIVAERGDVDILVHAALRHFAGEDGHEPRSFVDHSPSQVLETLAVAVTGPTLLTQLVCKRMVERRSGRIVLTGSMHRAGTPGLVMYSAAKAYVNALARGLFLELREYDIVTSVANPGGMHTGLHRHRYPGCWIRLWSRRSSSSTWRCPARSPSLASRWCPTILSIRIRSSLPVPSPTLPRGNAVRPRRG